MRTFRWDQLKKEAMLLATGNWTDGLNWKVVAQAMAAGIQQDQFDWRKNVETFRKMVCATIDQWDIREVAKLIKLFPSIIPKCYLNTTPRCHIADGETYEWLVTFGKERD